MQTAIASVDGTYWQWQDHSIYYVHAGPTISAKPPLLLVHGFGASTDHWRKNIQDWQQDFDVWAIDLLGFGRSAKPDLQYSGTVWQDQLHDFITHVIGSPVVLVGNSLGGYASLCVAAQYVDSVKGVILLNSAGPFDQPGHSTKETASVLPITLQIQHQIKQLWGQAVRTVLLQPLPSFLLFQYVRRRRTIRKTLLKVYHDQSAVTDQLVEDIHRPSGDPGAAKVFASVFKAKRGEPVNVLLKQMNCPLLLVWGEADPWMDTRERGEMFRKYYPSLTEYYLDAGHCPHDEAPQQVNPVIRNWVIDTVR